MTEQMNTAAGRSGWGSLILCWVLLGLAFAGVTFLMLSVRDWAQKTYGTNEAADWNDWRESAKEMSENGPVQRRVPDTPGSAEPPTIRLMRDHFMACLVGTWILTLGIAGTMIFMLRGAFTSQFEPTLRDAEAD